MDDSETKDEKVGENNDVLDVDSLDSFPSLPTTGSQKSADDIEKENKQKNTCIDNYDDNLAKGTSTVPTGELNTAGVNQLKVDTPVDTDGVFGVADFSSPPTPPTKIVDYGILRNCSNVGFLPQKEVAHFMTGRGHKHEFYTQFD